jgi:cell division protein FtsQ
MRARRRAYGRKLGLALFTALSGTLAFSVLTDGGRQTRSVVPLLPEFDQMLHWTGLRIEQVGLSGQRLTPDLDIFDAIGLRDAGSLLTFDGTTARARIEALPWIETASINRVFPNSLEVRVSERSAYALWQRGDREYLVDATGRVLSSVKAGSHAGLPRIAGEGAPEQAKALIDLVVRYPLIAERFRSAERVGERRWTLHLKDNVVVHLGVDREAVAFAALSAPGGLGKLMSDRDLVIDLRTSGRFTVRPNPQPAAAPSAAATQS